MNRPTQAVAALLLLILAAPSALAQDGGPDGDVDGGDGGGGADAGEEDGGTPPLPCPPDVTGCDGAGAHWTYRDALFDDFDLDTGWQPPGSPLQLRFALALGGSTQVDMAGTVFAAWPPALGIGVAGWEEQGRLSINYGLELVAQLRFDVEVAGIRYHWEGDIPVPGIPEDLRMAGEVIFDPFLLPGAAGRPVSVRDLTDPVRVLYYDALDSIIPVPGVGGGLLVALQGDLEAGYQTDRFVVTGAEDPIDEQGGMTTLLPDPRHDGFGSSATVEIHPEGTLAYDGVILIIPSLYIEVVGVRFDYPLVEIPVPLVSSDVAAIFDDELVEIPLPDVDISPPQLDLGTAIMGETVEGVLTVENLGEAELEVRVRAVGEPFGTRDLSVAVEPGDIAPLLVTFTPDSVGGAASMMLLDTNDPDEPEIRIMLVGEGLPAPEIPDAGPDADAGPPDADGGEPPPRGGCACRAGHDGAGGGGLPLALLTVSLLLGLRRRRVRER